MSDKDDMQELKPCDFCGGVPDFEYEAGTCAYIYCCNIVNYEVQISDVLDDLGLRFCDNHRYAKDKEHAYPDKTIEIVKAVMVKHWNTRATPEQDSDLHTAYMLGAHDAKRARVPEIEGIEEALEYAETWQPSSSAELAYKHYNKYVECTRAYLKLTSDNN